MTRKIIRVIAIILIVSLMAGMMSGCYGKFRLTQKLYKWNGQVGDKFVNSAVMWVFLILPVYEISGLLDLAVLNVIEFWTGKNPVAMNDDESDTQLVQYNGKEYLVVATQNKFEIYPKDSDQVTAALIFNPENQTWQSFTPESGEIVLAKIDKDSPEILHLIQPDGSQIDINTAENRILLK